MKENLDKLVQKYIQMKPLSDIERVVGSMGRNGYDKQQGQGQGR